MTPRISRLFVFLDEWLWIGLCLYLHRFDPSLFWPVLVVGAVMVYPVGYGMHWKITGERPW